MMVLAGLAEITVYSAVLYAAILLFRMLFRHKMSAALQYGLWFVLLLRLLVPVTIDSGIHLITLEQNEMPSIQAIQSEPIISGQGNPQTPIENANTLFPQEQIDSQASSGDVQTVAQPDFQETQPIPTDRGIWSLEHILLAVWGAGILAVSAWFAALYLRLSASIARNRQPLPGFCLETYKKIKSDLGIRRGPPPVMIRGITTPALSVSFAPKLLLPAGNMPGEANLEHIFRHELTHYKRGDHIVCLLLTALRCIYWFNPVVWLAARQMQHDMEISCDSIAVKNMDVERKRQYAATLLELLSRPGKTEPAMGMGMENNRTSAEKRIRGVFMSAISKRSAIMAAALTVLLLLATCFTTACQPTAMQADPSLIACTQAPSPTATLLQTPGSTSALPTASPSATPDDHTTEPTAAPLTTTLEPSATPSPIPAPTPTPGPKPSDSSLAKQQGKSRMIAGNIAVGNFTFAITKNGKILQAGNNTEYGIDTSKWSGIVAVSSGFVHVVGLRANGTVVVAGSQRSYLSRYIEDWKEIIAISACGNNTIMGMKSDGTVLSTGIFYDSSDPDKVKNWKDIVAIAAGEGFGIGLKADGTVVATGNNEYGQCNVDDWTGIVAIAASTRTVLGLRSDGTVVATGYNNGGECNVESWRDIVSIAVGGYSSYGLKADGTVVAVGDGYLGQNNTGKWTDIIAISAGSGHAAGLRADGTMVAVGSNEEGACEVEEWKGLATIRLKFK